MGSEGSNAGVNRKSDGFLLLKSMPDRAHFWRQIPVSRRAVFLESLRKDFTSAEEAAKFFGAPLEEIRAIPVEFSGTQVVEAQSSEDNPLLRSLRTLPPTDRLASVHELLTEAMEGREISAIRAKAEVAERLGISVDALERLMLPTHEELTQWERRVKLREAVDALSQLEEPSVLDTEDRPAPEEPAQVEEEVAEPVSEIQEEAREETPEAEVLEEPEQPARPKEALEPVSTPPRWTMPGANIKYGVRGWEKIQKSPFGERKLTVFIGPEHLKRMEVLTSPEAYLALWKEGRLTYQNGVPMTDEGRPDHYPSVEKISE